MKTSKIQKLAFAGMLDYTLGMKESGKKAYEIAYALWRIAANTQEKAFAEILRNKAIEVVGFAAGENYAGLVAASDALQAVIKFAVDVNCIGINNAAILAREIGNLKSAISFSEDRSPEIEIADIFSPPEELPVEQEPEIVLDEDFFEPIKMDQELGKKAEIRQSAIIERIRQIGNCRLGDIQAILPDTSERTLRYDLESLVQRNMIERIGTGGRSVYYKMRQIVGEA